MTTDINSCTYWEPSIRVVNKPKPHGSFIPIYPVYLYRSTPTSFTRSWYWLWYCTKCGGERIMSNKYIVPDSDTCSCGDKVDKTVKSVKYPYENKSVCEMCGEEFTYMRKNKYHILKFCSKKCVFLDRSVRQKLSAEKNRIRDRVKFDRFTFCIRPDGPAYALCDKYHKCQDHRVDGNMGPYYVKDGSCYYFTGINVV